MGATDFVTTDTQREEAGRGLVQTERTDAVNTGLVGSSDKSASILKDGRRSAAKSKSPSSNAQASLAAVSRGKRQGGDADGAEDATADAKTGAQARTHMDAAALENVKATAMDGATAAAGLAASRTLDDTELDGMDDAYYKGSGTIRATRAIKRRLSKPNGRAARGGRKPGLGGLSEKGYRSKAASTTPQEAQRNAQASMYMRRSINASKSASTASTGTGATGAATAGSTGGAAAGSAGGGGLAIASMAPVLLCVFAGILCVFLILSAVLSGGSHEEEKSDVGALDGVAAEIATSLRGYGFTDEAIAAVLGNMQQESGLNPALDADDGYGTTSLGLLQYTGSERVDFQRWCAAHGKVWSSASAQMEWTFSGEAGTSSYAARWSTNLAGSYYRLEDGYDARFGTDYLRTPDAFKTATDLDLATYSWMACYEKPGSRVSYGDDVSRLDNRLAYARDFLSKLRSGGSFVGGEDLASAEPWQKSIVSAAQSVPSPGAGLCAMWVSQVYQRAGLGYPSGNGNSMLAGHATSTDFANIKVGQIISAQRGSNTPSGNAYGHVGIYVGGGMVMDNIGSIRTIPLNDWISQNNRGWVVYGWPW